MKPELNNFMCGGCQRRTTDCTSHYITFDTIYEIVLADIRKNLFWYRKDRARFREFLGGKYKSMTDKAAKQLQAEYEQKQRRAAELNRILCKLYEDNALDVQLEMNEEFSNSTTIILEPDFEEAL